MQRSLRFKGICCTWPWRHSWLCHVAGGHDSQHALPKLDPAIGEFQVEMIRNNQNPEPAKICLEQLKYTECPRETVQGMVSQMHTQPRSYETQAIVNTAKEQDHRVCPSDWSVVWLLWLLQKLWLLPGSACFISIMFIYYHSRPPKPVYAIIYNHISKFSALPVGNLW